MTKSAVAIVQAAVVVRAQIEDRMAMGKVAQREKTDRGVSSMQRKANGAEIRNRANIQWEIVRTSPRIVRMLFGRATEQAGQR